MGFFAELKRRNVIRMAGLYLVGAWLLVQIAETLLPIFDTPGWVLKVLVVLLALGFVPALVISWAYEMTPEGLKRDRDVDPSHTVTAQTAKRLDVLTLAALGLVVLLFAADRFWPTETGSGSLSAETPPSQAAQASEPDPVSAASAAADQLDRRSIAVLPFVNMSPDPDNEYFADGMSEELLNILAGIDGLKVASRTSAFSFKGKDTPIPDIARQLGVHHVLEGSVRKQGNRVKITAQLIEAGSDAHLWTQTYQRDLDDIFLVQEEIAAAITTALKDILGVQQVKVDAPTRDMVAYQRYLHGRSRFYQRAELDQAIEDLSFAVDRDPEFAEAWAFLAATYSILGNGGYASLRDRSEMERLAGPASDRAIALKPDLPMALAVKSEVIKESKAPGRIAESIRLLERALSLPSPDTTPRLWLAITWLELGYVDRAMPLLGSAHSADPMVGINAGYLGFARAIEGRDTQAHELVLQAVQLNGLTFWVDLIAIDRVHAGDPAAAIELLSATLPLLRDRFEAEHARVSDLLLTLQEPSRRAAYLQNSPQRHVEEGLDDRASMMFGKGDVPFELAQQNPIHFWLILQSAWMPAMQWLREDPRYFRLMQQRGYVEYWDSHGYPRGCNPVDGPDGRHLSCPES